MWSKTYHTNGRTVPFLLGFGVVIFFVVLVWLGIFISHKFTMGTLVNSPTPITAPAQISQEYIHKITELETALSTTQITREVAEQKMNDFFFSVRVPQNFRDLHLSTVIQFKSNSQLTVSDWQKLIRDLHDSVLKLSTSV
jgi:uncharacterized protein YneF (UPF0154 family)